MSINSKTFMVYGAFTEPTTKLNFIVVSMPERGVRWRVAMVAVKRVIRPWFEAGSKARERTWNVDGDVDGAKKVGALHFEWKEGEFVEVVSDS